MSLKAYVKKLKSDAERSGGGEYFKCKDGLNRIVLFPGYVHNGKFVEKPFIKTGTHHDAPNGQAVKCPRVIHGGKCRMCEAWYDAKDGKGDEEDLETCKVSPQYMCSVLDLDNKEAGVQIWFCPSGVQKNILELLSDPTVYNLDSAITWMRENPVLRFKKSGKGLGTKYSAPIPERKPIPMSLKKWKKKLPDLEGFVNKNVPTYIQTKKAYNGVPLKMYKKDGDKGGKNRVAGKKGKRHTKR